MSEWTASSALQDAAGKLPEFTGNSIRLRPGPRRTRLKLQCRPDVVLDMAAFERMLGSSMPSTNHGTTGAEFAVFWLAPNEWLIVSADIDAALSREKLAALVSGQTHAINDLGDSLVSIEVSGENSQVLLAEGCGIDLHAAKFSTGQYASTRFLDSSIIIHRISDEPGFYLYVDRSVALHLWHWLADGARQFGLGSQ